MRCEGKWMDGGTTSGRTGASTAVFGALDALDKRLVRIDANLEVMDDRLRSVENRVERIEERVIFTATKADVLQCQTDVYRAINMQTWRLVTFVSGFGALLTAATFYIARSVP